MTAQSSTRMSPNSRTFEVLPTPEAMFQRAAEEFVRLGRSAIGAQGRFSVALSGGSTPKALYTLLGTRYADFNWARTFLFFGDERHVGPDDAESNYRMVKESLLSKIAIPEGNVHRVRAENPDAAAAASEYEKEVRSFFELKPGEFPRFDLILLGMGPDGHTASLFPESKALSDDKHLVVANWVEKFKTNRITFTFPVLNNAAEVVFLAAGADKAEMVARILQGKETPPLPSQRVLPADGKLLWLLDEAAAAKLKK